jgi:CheY-like chemotaxis protein
MGRKQKGKMATANLMIVDARPNLFTLRTVLEQRYEIAVGHTRNIAAALELVRSFPPDLILLNPYGIGPKVKEFLSQLAQETRTTPVVVVGNEQETHDLDTTYPHIVGHVPIVYNEADLLPFLKTRALTDTGPLNGMPLAERAALVQSNQALEQRVQELRTLQQIGRSVASLTDLDTILARITEAAVFLLRAEEASIMLREPNSDALYLRAQKGLGEKQARGFNLRVEDTLIGSVVRTGKPVRMARDANTNVRLKVVTGYMVNALLYVPLTLRGEVIGVLGAANQTAAKAFGSHDESLMEALADYAALAIEVARQHTAIQLIVEELAVANTITDAVTQLRQRLTADDPTVLGALHRIDGAAQILLRLAEKEAPSSV